MWKLSPKLRTCCNGSCKLNLVSDYRCECRNVFYCCKECQVEDYEQHRKLCVTMMKEDTPCLCPSHQRSMTLDGALVFVNMGKIHNARGKQVEGKAEILKTVDVLMGQKFAMRSPGEESLEESIYTRIMDAVSKPILEINTLFMLQNITECLALVSGDYVDNCTWVSAMRAYKKVMSVMTSNNLAMRRFDNFCYRMEVLSTQVCIELGQVLEANAIVETINAMDAEKKVCVGAKLRELTVSIRRSFMVRGEEERISLLHNLARQASMLDMKERSKPDECKGYSLEDHGNYARYYAHVSKVNPLHPVPVGIPGSLIPSMRYTGILRAGGTKRGSPVRAGPHRQSSEGRSEGALREVGSRLWLSHSRARPHSCWDVPRALQLRRHQGVAGGGQEAHETHEQVFPNPVLLNVYTS